MFSFLRVEKDPEAHRATGLRVAASRQGTYVEWQDERGGCAAKRMRRALGLPVETCCLALGFVFMRCLSEWRTPVVKQLRLQAITLLPRCQSHSQKQTTPFLLQFFLFPHHRYATQPARQSR